MSKPLLLKKHDELKIVCGKFATEARVTLASANGRSLALSIPGTFDGYVFSVPLLWVDEAGGYTDLIEGRLVEVTQR